MPGSRQDKMTGAVAGYSLPVGSVHSLVTAAASLMEMQVAGGWQSPAMPGRGCDTA